jgi:hypothetical protein
MTIFVRDNGDLECYQGDNGSIDITGIPTDQNYQVFFAIRDPNTNSPVINELVQNSNSASSVRFSFSARLTDSFPVLPGASKTSFAYGVKVCDMLGVETTVIPRVELDITGNPIFKKAPKFIVHTKKVSGKGI